MNTPESLLTVREVAAYLTCAEETVKRLVRRGELPATRIGTRLRFARADIEAYEAAHGTTARARAAPSRTAAEAAHARDIGDEHGARTFDTAQLQQAQNQTARIQALAVASDIFAEAELQLPTLLDRVAGQVAAVLGDHCTIRLVSADGQWLNPVAVYHPDPEARALLRSLASEYTYRSDEGLTGRVFQSGQPLLLPSLSSDELRTVLKPEYWPYAERFGMVSILVVPLRVQRDVIGTLFVSRDAAGRPYTLVDQLFLQELASRAAIAIANGRLYAAEQGARAAAEQAAERTAILQNVTAELSDLHTPAQIADIALNEGMRALGATAGGLSLLNDDDTFTIVRMLGYPQSVVDRWVGQRYPATLQAPIPDAVRTQSPIWLESSDAITARYPDLVAQLADEQRGAWATVPLGVQERVFGGVSFLFGEPRAFTGAERALLLALAQQCAQAIDRARLREAEQAARNEVEASRERLALLAEASVELSTSLDVQRTLEALARLVVPRLADWCVVDMLMDDGSIQTLAVAHSDPAREAIGWDMVRRYAIDPDAPGGTAAVLRTRQPELIPNISDAALALVARDPEHLRLLKDLGIHSTLCVPLVARGRALGTIALVAAESRRQYGEADLPFVEDLAHRAALAVDNARLYREAQDAIGLRDTFFSIAAHELRTPLTSLLGQAQLIQRRAKREGGLGENYLQSLKVIEQQAARLNNMILAMLDTARLEQGQLSLDLRRVNLRDLIQRVVLELQPTFERHTITVVEQGEPLAVFGDALRLEQVLQNLISNAVKYSPAGGPVGVQLERAGEQARIMVRDEGIGIPPAAIPQLFHRFYRASNVDAQHISGMGIGLYVVKEIVALHGGTVAVESLEQQGSTFIVMLPLAEPV